MLKITKMLAVLVAVLALSTPASAAWTETKFMATTPVAGDKLGTLDGVEISGNIGIAGGFPAGGNMGKAYLFDVTTGLETFPLVPTGGTPAGALFGISVGIDGNLAVVGARGVDKAYLFNVSTGAQVGEILGSGGFGADVSVSGNTVAIASQWDKDIHVYDVTTPASPVSLGAAPIHRDGYFGGPGQVALSGNTLVAGESNTGPNWFGSAYVYDLSVLGPGTGTAVEVQLDPLYTPNGGEQLYMGGSVDVEDGLAIVGAPLAGDDSGGPLWNAGMAFLFDVSNPASPTKLAEIVPDDRAGEHRFGSSVGVSGDTVIVGGITRYAPPSQWSTPGEAYLFDVSDTNNISQIQKMTTGEIMNVDGFGVPVAIDGTVALVGAGNDDEGASDSGAVYIYTGPPLELTWQGGTGLWSDLGNDNWTDGDTADLPPSAKTNMFIDAATNDSVVTLGADFMTGGAGPARSVAVGANSTASLTVNGGVTLDVTGGVGIGGSGTMLVNGALTAGGGVTVASGGTLGGSGTITGAVTVDSGGTVAPGASIGTLSVTGNVAVGGGYTAEVSGSGAPIAGTNNDLLDVTGDVTAGAMGLDLVWLVGAKIGAEGDGKFGGEYTIVTGTTVSGSPANVTVNSFVAKFPDGHTVDMWDSYYHDVTGPSGPGDVLVTVGPADPFTDKVTVTLPQVLRGDSTLDGRVMMNDALPIILNWQKTVPVGTGWELGNFNFDDKIMMNDALEIILSWGQQTDADPPGPNPAGAVEAAAVADRATAVYDVATGFVWLEVNSALAYLQIIDPNSSGELGPKDPDGTKPFVGFHPLMAAALLEDERPHHVGEMNFGGLPQTAGPHLYVEATPGIPQEDFDFVLYTAALDWTDATVDVVWTPEPATMTLLLMGGAVVLARRRRRR